MIVIRILCFSKFTEIDLSHNVEEDVETEIESEDESPIGMCT